MTEEDSREFVVGVDEAGRGPLAGPVTAACVTFPTGYENTHIRDSKKLSSAKREKLYNDIVNDCTGYSVVSVGQRRIEYLNIRSASLLAMSLAVNRLFDKLAPLYEHKLRLRLLIDGNAPIESRFPQKTIIGGDAKILSISAASILAKVTRDRLMNSLQKYYPGYEFSLHKGYPTSLHKQKIAELGPSPVHRRTFKGVKEFIV